MRLLSETGNLDVCYTGDSEIYMRSGYMPNGELVCVLFNLSYDIHDEVELLVNDEVEKIEFLRADGQRDKCVFEQKDGMLYMKKSLAPLDPLVLFIKKR